MTACTALCDVCVVSGDVFALTPAVYAPQSVVNPVYSLFFTLSHMLFVVHRRYLHYYALLVGRCAGQIVACGLKPRLSCMPGTSAGHQVSPSLAYQKMVTVLFVVLLTWTAQQATPPPYNHLSAACTCCPAGLLWLPYINCLFRTMLRGVWQMHELSRAWLVEEGIASTDSSPEPAYCTLCAQPAVAILLQLR